MIDSPTLIRSIPGASWLPAHGTAQVWVGTDLAVPEPVVIVRLLVQRTTQAGKELFCVQTAKGLDIPTVFLGSGDEWRPWSEGIAELTSHFLSQGVSTRCVGFVRNVVPIPDDTYRLPTPIAHVPVFTPVDPSLEPADGTGTWIGAADALSLLTERHWWPMACEVLDWPPSD